MRIKTFEEFINEGLISKSVMRSKSGEKRLEDKFTKSDISVFNFSKYGSAYYDFLRKNNIYNLFKETYFEKLNETYKDFILDYAKKHGTIDLGFTEEDKAKMPDFHWSFQIETLKNVTIYIDYTDQNKTIEIYCGNNKKEFDISETTFGHFFIKSFDKLLTETLEDESEILIDNLNMHFELFKNLLFDCVHECCLKSFQYEIKYNQELSPIDSIEIIPAEYSYELYKFFFDGVSYGESQPRVFIGGKDITFTKIGEEILQIYDDAYKEALENIEK